MMWTYGSLQPKQGKMRTDQAKTQHTQMGANEKGEKHTLDTKPKTQWMMVQQNT